MNQTLNDLLYVSHANDLQNNGSNIHIYTFNLTFSIIFDTKDYKKIIYYKKSKAFKLLCKLMQDNIPKNIFIKDNDGRYEIDIKHKKYNLYITLRHAITYALNNLGF